MPAKLIFLILIGVLTLALGTFVSTSADAPIDCDPSDREIPGNTNSPCLWNYHLDEAASVEFVMVKEYPICYGVFRFHGVNYTRDIAPGGGSGPPRVYPSRRNTSGRWNDRENYSLSVIDIYGVTGNDEYVSIRATDNYGVDSTVPDFYPLEDLVSLIDDTHIYLAMFQSEKNRYAGPHPLHRRGYFSPYFNIPASWAIRGQLINACITELAAEKSAREEETRLEQAKIVEEANLRAARIELASVERRLETVKEIEKIVTEALEVRLEIQARIEDIEQQILTAQLEATRAKTEITTAYLDEALLSWDLWYENIRPLVNEINRIQAKNENEKRTLEARIVEEQAKARTAQERAAALIAEIAAAADEVN